MEAAKKNGEPLTRSKDMRICKGYVRMRVSLSLSFFLSLFLSLSFVSTLAGKTRVS